MIIKNILFLSIVLIAPVYSAAKIIVIHPAGSIHNPGRSIAATFERGLTLQCAQLLQEALEKQPSAQQHNCIVHISNKAGQSMTNLEYAQYINQLVPDICITLNMYADASTIAPIALFYYSNSALSPLQQKQQNLFTPLERTHEQFYHQSKGYAHTLYEKLLTSTICIPINPIACPYAPLIGIAVPAIGIEIGVHENNWQLCIDPLADALLYLLRQ